jgi:amino acid adenylation domain-containing protein
MSNIREHVSDLPLKEKRELLSKLLREEAGGDETFPLSFAQQRLWFLAQLEPNNPSYNLPQTLRLKGVLDVNALEQTIHTIIARHESLRTTFKAIDGQPVQIVSGAHEFKLPFTDLKELPEAERETEARRLAIAEARRPFDLTHDYPLRAALVRIEDDDHRLFLTIHHIVSDGWSMGILTKELSNIYDAIATNQPIELPELPVQYADFAEWQREWLQGEVLEEQLGYWLKSLAGAPAELKLQTDHPRLPHQSFQGASLSLRLSQKLSRSLSELSQREGVTLFMTMLGAFQTLLFRYTGQEDIVVGTPIAGRNRVEIESLIGFFVNTLALRTNVSGNPTFRQLLGRVREVALGAYAHQDLPFEKLVEELNPERDVSRSPVFQVMFGMQNVPRGTLTPSGLTITRVPTASGTAKFDLTLLLNETATGLVCWLEYNTDLFEKDTIARMLGHYENLLKGIVANPEERLSMLPLLTDAERQQLLLEWNDTTTDYPRNECIHELFEVQVERSPDAIAVVFEDEQLTYAQLNVRANQLAHYLRKRGIGLEALVGICMERSVELIVGLLGILKAGGAYVPLDPSYPRERLSFMLEDARVPVLLVQQHLREKLPEPSATVIALDAEQESIATESAANPEHLGTSENLAYVIYTSGSTGRPKGTMISHRGLVNYVSWCTEAYEVEKGNGAPVHSSISFDLTITGLFAPLLSGCPVHLLFEDLGIEGLSLALRKVGGFSLVKLTPSHLDLLKQQLSPPEVAGASRALIIGGENLRAESIKFWQDFAPETMLVNEYGPTETVVGCCVYKVTDSRHLYGSVPIGRPIANVQLYVLDKHLHPVPIGVPGELYIGGVGVARGYLNRPEQTSERFIPDPFAETPGSRLYKSGDRVRFLTDGNLEFLGRSDNQVKVRGYRVELDEIEAVLAEHPAVSDSAVLALDDAQGDKRIVAYVVQDRVSERDHVSQSQMSHQDMSEQSSVVGDPEFRLRSFLKERLPGYMVPSSFVILDRLPLTPNGKLDRNLLPGLDSVRAETHKFVAPRTPVEEIVAGIWSEVLGIDRVGINDGFFELGGHSLLATQVISRVREAFNLEIPLRIMFEDSTVARLAVSITQAQAKQAEQEDVSRLLAELNELSDEDAQRLLALDMRNII